VARWNPVRRYRDALTASVQIVQPQPPQPPNSKPSSSRQLYRSADPWQREVWDFYDSLGEFLQGVTWKANMMSRVRLRAARMLPNQDEPEIISDGPAHDIVRELGGSIGGQSDIMAAFEVYLSVPGECYLIGETIPNTKTQEYPAGKNKWYARSIEEVRPSAEDPKLMSVKDGGWRTLPPDSYVARVWRAHKRWHGVATSPARGARSTLRELELVSRHIQAQYMSRLASAGIVLFPDDITFPVRPEFEDAPDPFIAEWIEIAAEAIKTPGSAVAAVPIPMKVPGEYLDKIQHLDFTLKLDEKIIEKRDSALTKLAVELDMPSEALLGGANSSHWNLWLIDEQGVKTHIAPDAEVICNALTEAYLWPRLEAAGIDPSELCVWYDASELIQRPDRSAAAKDGYDRVELSGRALRRELGFDESDAPTDDERRDIILLKAALQPVNVFNAMDELGFKTSHDTPPADPRPPAEPPPVTTPEDNRTPPNENPKNQSNPNAAAERAVLQAAADEVRQRLLQQSKLMHAVHVDAMRGEWSLLHPKDCDEHQFSCPLTHATWKPIVSALPGTSGTYRCWLNTSGQPIMGERIFNGEAEDMIVTRPRPINVPLKI
jgi:hypothetical protein